MLSIFYCTATQLKAEIAGLQMILIGDAHSLPMLDLNIQKFTVDVHDWSGDVSPGMRGLQRYLHADCQFLPLTQMRMNTSIGAYINYYNLSRSHWEPLIDPWVFRVDVSTS